jgi:hypothetical protein
MNDKQINQNPRGYSPGIINSFLAGLAGYDLRLLPWYAGPLVEHEKKKLVRVGSSVLIPSFFGFCTAYYFFGSFIDDPQRLLLSSIAFALLLLVVDCVIVTTLSKTKIFGLFIRIAMSICIGIVVSEPALLYLYHETINARIEAQLQTEKTAAETKLKTDLDDARQNLSALEEQLKVQREKLANYSDQKIANLRYLEAEDLKKQRLARIAENKKQQAADKQGILAGLQAERKTKGAEIESKMLEMKEEENGKRASAKAGRGPFWEKLNGELTTLKSEAATIDKQIKNINSEIAAIQTGRVEETRIDAQFKEPGVAGPATGLSLTKAEQAEKILLEHDVAASIEQQALYRENVERLAKEIAGLDAKFALSTRDDSLTQTRVLYEIAAANPVLLVKIFALFFLVFFIDTAPVLVKLTVQTGYDGYLRQLSQQSLSENRDIDLAYAQDCVNAATEKFDKLDRFSRHLTKGLDNTNAYRKGYPHEKIVHGEAYRLMDSLVRQLEHPEHPGSSFSFWRRFGRSWAVKKAKSEGSHGV